MLAIRHQMVKDMLKKMYIKKRDFEAHHEV
jgi:hypothetical protein